MERNLHNKVYINPNFKRAETFTCPTEPIRTTHFNRHYLEERSNGVTETKNNQATLNNRKIYVNPNFISSNNVAQSITPASAGYVEANENVNTVLNEKVHKSKYCFVQNVHRNCLQNVLSNEQTRNYADNARNENSVIKTNAESYQSTNETQDVHLTRSRYSIVRKNKKTSPNVEHKSKNKSVDFVTDINLASVPCLNEFTRNTNCNRFKNNEKIKCKTPEKITKIKVTKYKLIPVSYLKKNFAAETNKNKCVASAIRAYVKSDAKLNTPPLSTPNKNHFVKTSSRTQQVEKSVPHNGSKLKISRAKFKINNIPCRLFKKYGKCLRLDRGNCKYLHDKKHVALCRKFLKGICHDKDCSLSHEFTAKKMPTCYFYLKGLCTKEHCPYLHVKLNGKTKICQEFAKGYCESGDKCQFRHDNVHTKIDQSNTSKKSSCNSIKRRLQNKVTKSKEIKKKIVKSTDTINDDGECRYYKELVVNDVGSETIKPTRCKLGTLPSFIQL